MGLETGYFVASLDFEMMWGVRDIGKEKLESYRENLLGVRQVIPKTLALFQKYEIRGTFAVVGFLFFKSKQEMIADTPILLPKYRNNNLSPYGDNVLDEVENSYTKNSVYFAPDLIKLIQDNPAQEIGTHTYSHYYCLEEGQTVDDFKCDLNKAIEVAAENGVKVTSIIFPRNQFNENYLQVCKEAGIITFRNNEQAWFYQARNEQEESKVRRAFRLMDSYINLSGHNCVDDRIMASSFPIKIPSSRFLRPYSSKLKFLNRFQMRRIKKGMTYAAKNKLVYHLWWHPHNFGIDQNENFAYLEEILAHYKFLNQRYNFTSITMSDLAKKIY